MTPTPGDPVLLNHFTVAIYPFVHDLTASNRAARLHALDRRWAPWWARLSDGDAAEALDGSAFFLPYIRGLLYPETACLQGEPPGEQFGRWVGRIRRWGEDGLHSWRRRMPADAVLRLTCRLAVHAPLSSFALSVRRGAPGKTSLHTEIPGRLDWIDAVLFPSGLGFLAFKVQLDEDPPRLSRLIALNAALRLVHPPSLSWPLPTLRFAGGEELRTCDLMNFLTAGLTEPPHAPETLGRPVQRSADEAAYTDSEAGRAYGERLQVLSYACVNLAGLGPEELPAGAFAGGEDRVLYEFAAGHQLGDTVHNPVWAPSPEQAQRVTRENRLAMWRCWKAMVLKESCVFLAVEDLGFNRRSLPHTIENDYLPLYLYTLYQKFQLLAFSNDLMREVARGGRLGGARALLRRFVAFRNQYWFSEVTRKPMGGDLYRTLHQGLEAPALYQMVTTSVKEAQEYYEGVWARQAQWVRDALTFGGPLTAALWAAHVFLDGPNEYGWTLGVLAAVALGALAMLAVRWRGRRALRPRRPGKKGPPAPTSPPL